MQSEPRALTLQISLNAAPSGQHAAILYDDSRVQADQQGQQPHQRVHELLAEFRRNHPNLCINNIIPTHQDPVHMGDTFREILEGSGYVSGTGVTGYLKTFDITKDGAILLLTALVREPARLYNERP